MKLNKVDLNLFVAFDAIYTESSLSGAAQRLHVTQPAMSNTLNRLRELFDDPLFVRSGRGMMPTPGAQNIIGPVREALATLNASLHKLTSFDPATADKTFRFSMRDLNEAQLFPRLLELLQPEAPGVVVESFQIPREDAVKELASGRLDFVIDAPVLSDPQLRQQKLTEDEFVCVVREGHPIVDRELTLEKYLALPHIVVTSRRNGLSIIDRELEKIGKFRRISMRTQHSLMVPELVRRTDMTMTTVNSFSKFHTTRAMPLPFKMPPLEMYLYWHKSADLDPASRWLRQKLTASLQE